MSYTGISATDLPPAGVGPYVVALHHYANGKRSRFWGLYDDERLLGVFVYRKGAVSVGRLLSRLTGNQLLLLQSGTEPLHATGQYCECPECCAPSQGYLDDLGERQTTQALRHA